MKAQEAVQEAQTIAARHSHQELVPLHLLVAVTQRARDLLFREGYDPAYGARPLKWAIQRLIQDPLALKILNGEVSPGDRVVVDADLTKGEMRFERAGAAVATS